MQRPYGPRPEPLALPSDEGLPAPYDDGMPVRGCGEFHGHPGELMTSFSGINVENKDGAIPKQK